MREAELAEGGSALIDHPGGRAIDRLADRRHPAAGIEPRPRSAASPDR